MRKQLVITLAILIFLFGGTAIAVLYGQGYRFFLGKGKPEFSQTGMLVTTSIPDGASVFINDHLTTATNNTISLSPGEYLIKITQEGYFTWQKKIKIQKEVVSRADALLFAKAPKLSSLTTNGASNPLLDPSMTKLAYTVSSNSARKNGIYVLNMGDRPVLTLQNSSTQVADDTLDIFSKANLSWSPDGQELLATTSANPNNPTTYLLKAGSFNENPKDVTATLDQVASEWQKDKKEKETARLSTLKSVLRKIISDNFQVLSWSPDETKILYTASASATLPIVIKPRLLGVDSTPEQRLIEKDSLYVYDIKEDKNYELKVESGKLKIENSQLSLSWLPDSSHLLYVNDKKIDIMEFDGSNRTTVYAGPFLENYVYPWTNASKVVILTNLGNPDILPNLYTIELR